MALKITIVALILGAPPSPAAATPAPGPIDASPGQGDYRPRVTIAVHPGPLAPEDLGAIEGAAIGLMSPGLGEVTPEQTWLDVSQGARVFDRKYEYPLDTLSTSPGLVMGWPSAVARAATAGSGIRPGLLATAMWRNGFEAATAGGGIAGLAAVTRPGRLREAPPGCPGPACTAALAVVSVSSLSEAAGLVAERGRGELLIVVESPPAERGDQLAIAIAGPGFRGMLRSPSTRTPGYVLSTDLAPTILRHLGVETPPVMTGLPIDSGGRVDYAALAELEGRYEQVGERRDSALLIPLAAWMLIAALVVVAGRRRRLAEPAVRILCLSVVLLPAVLLLTAAISPSSVIESVIAATVPVLVALLIGRLVPGWGGLAIACAITVVAFAVDLVAGLALTPKAIIGPNPGLGARFYGIGNELESTLMILTSVGTGAAIQTWGSGLSRERAAAAFLLAGLAGTVVFASGRFGADVGAAIIFPVAAVVAAAVMLRRPRFAWLAVVAALAALILLAVADAITGGETHYLRSLFDGGSTDSAIGVLGHRLDATGDSFVRLSRLPVTIVALILIAIAWRSRDRIRAWLDGSQAVRAGLIAAAAGSLTGAITNDSGALFLHVGVLYLALVIGFTWALRPMKADL